MKPPPEELKEWIEVITRGLWTVVLGCLTCGLGVVTLVAIWRIVWGH